MNIVLGDAHMSAEYLNGYRNRMGEDSRSLYVDDVYSDVKRAAPPHIRYVLVKLLRFPSGRALVHLCAVLFFQ